MPEIVNGASINNAAPHTLVNYSTFPLEEKFLDTHRFGEYHPHLVIEGVPGDKQPWRCVHDARSYTLKAPLMQDIQMHKDYFMVTMRSILPLQAERIIKNPKIGDDVPADSYTSVPIFLRTYYDVCRKFYSLANSYINNSDYAQALTCYLKYLVLVESVWSRGSLLASLGCNLASTLVVTDYSDPSESKKLEFDDYFDFVMIKLFQAFPSIVVIIDGTTYKVTASPSEIGFGNVPEIAYRDFLQRIRDTGDWIITDSIDPDVFDAFVVNTDLGSTGLFSFDVQFNSEMPLDLKYLWAYHLAVAHYFTDDTVDYVYNADLFRQYIGSLYYVANGTAGIPSFDYNGLRLYYDFLSCKVFKEIANDTLYDANGKPTAAFCQYFLTLFGYARSLRFRDYFTGSRTRPLAIPSVNGADTDVPVVNNKVSVLDTTRSIQAQRFLNAVNAARTGFEGYLEAIFHVSPEYDLHNPLHLAHTVDSLFAAENENTGSAVFNNENPDGLDTRNNNVTAVFRGRSGDFEFSCNVKEFCVIIGVTSYDIERCYPDMIKRGFFTKDRFDMFLPQMQYIGDQAVYTHELYAGHPTQFGTAFSYQFHDMQYKQLVNRCAGAFNSKMLPGYAFLMPRPFLGEAQSLSPDFIRSRNAELDKFYLSLTSYSLGNYFHFIVAQKNICHAVRPMTRKPQIL